MIAPLHRKSSIQSYLRIIGGKWRRRKISFPVLPELRPTHDRIRETLFNWLAPVIEDADCLDLFAGSGALGFEALSRGAKSVVFVDNNKTVIKFLNENSKLLEIENCEIMRADIPEENLHFIQAPFDIIFLDPPFHKNLITPTISWLMENNCLKSGSLIYIEVEATLKLSIPDNWKQLRYKNTASLDYYLFSTEFP